jgi:hypothetical protein
VEDTTRSPYHTIKELKGFGLACREWFCRPGVCSRKRLRNLDLGRARGLYKGVKKSLEGIKNSERLK